MSNFGTVVNGERILVPRHGTCIFKSDEMNFIDGNLTVTYKGVSNFHGWCFSPKTEVTVADGKVKVPADVAVTEDEKCEHGVVEGGFRYLESKGNSSSGMVINNGKITNPVAAYGWIFAHDESFSVEKIAGGKIKVPADVCVSVDASSRNSVVSEMNFGSVICDSDMNFGFGMDGFFGGNFMTSNVVHSNNNSFAKPSSTAGRRKVKGYVNIHSDNNCEIDGNVNMLTGNNNTVNGNVNMLTGNNNTVYGKVSMNTGRNNTIY